MNNKFEDIINKHEIEDDLTNTKEEVIMQKLKEEFENAYELIDYFNKNIKLKLKDCLSLSNLNFQSEIIPIRKEENFKIRKHTTVQIPYIHAHSFYEIIYVYKGSCKQIIGEFKEEVILQKNEFCLIFPKITHEILPSTKSDVIFKLHIPSKIFCKNFIEYKEEFRDYVIYKNKSDYVEHLILKILDEASHDYKYKDLAIDNLLSLLFVESQRNDFKKYSPILNQLETYFENNLHNASRKNFSNIVGYSSAYTAKIIKEQSNKSFTQLLIDWKMNKAKLLLSETNKTIDDIAFDIGYDNTSGFYKAFTAQHGITPLRYRNLLK